MTLLRLGLGLETKCICANHWRLASTWMCSWDTIKDRHFHHPPFAWFVNVNFCLAVLHDQKKKKSNRTLCAMWWLDGGCRNTKNAFFCIFFGQFMVKIRIKIKTLANYPATVQSHKVNYTIWIQFKMLDYKFHSSTFFSSFFFVYLHLSFFLLFNSELIKDR